jgi:hypothetical protein
MLNNVTGTDAVLRGAPAVEVGLGVEAGRVVASAVFVTGAGVF